ncbi:hypothetical protein [Hydrogenophaga sp. RWCD_12]|uniref:hypothetical protein n=1 Tax=Hydrogenophaga sp. RWCD_12 TaxID=3391190 RepID=UPI003984C5CD
MTPRHPFHIAFLATSITALSAFAACSKPPEADVLVVPSRPSTVPVAANAEPADSGLGLKASSKASQ